MNKSFNKILALDSSSHRLLLGLQKDFDRIIKIDEATENSHGQILMKKIDQLSKSAETELSELDGIIVGIGPGSFTGLRIGLAAVKALAVAFEIPIVDFSLFEMAAYKLNDISQPVTILIPFKKDQFFSLKIDSQQIDLSQITEISLTSLLELPAETSLASYGADLDEFKSGYFVNNLSDKIKYDASDIIAVGLTKLQDGQFADIAELEPLYIKKSEAEINFDRRNQK